MDTNSTSNKSPARPTTHVERVPAASHRAPHVRTTRLRAKTSGQAAVIIALSMLVLLAMVGLAVDGGSMYNERRTAQNGADGAAMAGTRQMLTWYEAMVAGTQDTGVDVDAWPDATQAAAREDVVRTVIDQYASANGVMTSTLKAYFVNDGGDIISVNSGQGCGWNMGSACQVGYNGVIPWASGEAARGIKITGTAQTGSYFMRVIGWNTVSATANATAYMGVANDSGYNVNLFPVGFFTQTNMVDNLVEGHTYTLIAKVAGVSSGNWGWINYTPNGGNSNVLRAWEDCGFNPSTTSTTWPNWCPSDSNVHGEGPLQYWTGWPNPDLSTVYSGLTIRFGSGLDGWWINGNSGDINSACQNLQGLDGKKYIVPVSDSQQGTGSNTYFHLYRLAQFTIHPHIVSCNGNFEVDGTFDQTYSPGSSGWHGDIRHNSLHLIFLSP